MIVLGREDIGLKQDPSESNPKNIQAIERKCSLSAGWLRLGEHKPGIVQWTMLVCVGS